MGDSFVEEALASYDPYTVTPLCRIMRAGGSDKGMGRHNYTTLYSRLFEPLLGAEGVRVFELGLGAGNPGASHRGWARYLPRALVFGADDDPGRLALARAAEPRIPCFHVDQSDPASVDALWRQGELASSEFDVIIASGSRDFGANVCFFEGSWRKLRAGGLFVVEDLAPDACARLGEWGRSGADVRFHLARVPNPCDDSGVDDTVLVAQRAAG